MKKQLLAGAFVLASFFTAQAQISISFEETEGYTLGTVVGQDDWQISSASSTEDNALVSDEFANDGVNSLKIATTNTQGTTLLGVFSPAFENPLTNFSVSQEVYTPSFDVEAGSSLYVSTYELDEAGTTVTIASRIVFSFDGGVFAVTGIVNNALNYEQIGSYEAGTWYTVTTTFDTVSGTITYSLNGEDLSTVDIFNGVTVNVLGYATDDYTTDFYVDNILIDEATAGLNDNTITNLSVFPNPSNDVVNVTADALVNNIAIVDLNGRTVKAVKFNGVAEAQVNVSDLASGVYMMTIASDKGTTTKKIVKN